MVMKLKSISKYKDGDKSIKVKEAPKPSFADKIKPLTPEQKAKGDKVNELDKKKKLFDDGTKKLEAPTTQAGKARKMTLTTTTTPGTPGITGTKDSARIKEETMQKNKVTGKVELKEGFTDSANKDRSGQTDLRRKALDEANKNLDKYNHGDKITYDTPKGKQHAGTVEKIKGTKETPPTPPTKSVKKEVVASTGYTAKRPKAVLSSQELKQQIASEKAGGQFRANGVAQSNRNSGNYEPKKTPKGTVIDDMKEQKAKVKGGYKTGVKKMKLRGC